VPAGLTSSLPDPSQVPSCDLQFVDRNAPASKSPYKRAAGVPTYLDLPLITPLREINLQVPDNLGPMQKCNVTEGLPEGEAAAAVQHSCEHVKLVTFTQSSELLQRLQVWYTVSTTAMLLCCRY
jgi:hypothetical protein